MKTKLDIFILRGGIQTELVDSFSHNNCNVILFSTIDEMLASSVSSPELIVLDEPELTLEKQRVQIKLDYRFPMSEIIYLSSDDTLPVKGKYSINEKSSVLIDEMLYFITYDEHFETDTLVVNNVHNTTQRFFIPLAVGLLASVLAGSLFFA